VGSLRVNKEGGKMKRNVVNIQLKEDIIPEARWRTTLLRSAKKTGDVETVNHTQLGTLKRMGIQFDKIYFID